MNKRARNRLIAVAAIILLLTVVAVVTLQSGGQESKNVTSLLADKAAVGQRVKVTGIVIGESWNGKANPMRFEVRDDNAKDASGPVLPVVYSGVVPSGFGDKTKATLTGALDADGVFQATDMLTQCPSKYKAKGSAESIDQFLARGDAVKGKTVKITGFVTGPAAADGSFQVQSRTDGGGTLTIVPADAATNPVGIGKGASVELTGELGADGAFHSTQIVVTKKAST